MSKKQNKKLESDREHLQLQDHRRAQQCCFSISAFQGFNVTNEIYSDAVLCHTDIVEDLTSCSETCKYLWDGFGQWKNEQWTPYLKGWN